eukprot:scaffold69629_cov69-Phaeocystis_antarctica.AAC.6
MRGVAPPAGRGGWRCARRGHREGDHAAAHRTAGAPSRPAAAPCAPPGPSSPRALSPPGVACPPPGVASPRRCGAGASPPYVPRRSQRLACPRRPAQPRRRRR